MPIPRRALLALMLLACAQLAGAGSLVLVEPVEFEREQAHQRSLPAEELNPPRPLLRALPSVMRVVTPRGESDTLKAPLRIEIVFDSGRGARIVPASFRVLYGLLKLDVTERIRSHARIDDHGVVAEQAVLPSGAHRLYLQVSDDRGRVHERELRFRVE